MAKFDPKAKAKRQKIIAAVLGVVLVGVLIFQAPTIMSMFGGGSSTVASEPSPTPPPAAAPSSPAAATPTPPPSASAQLVDSDPAPAAADGQLVTFDRFHSKDPFVPQISETPAGQTPSVPVDTDAKADSPEGEAMQQPPPPPAPAQAPAKTATISVNGVEQRVAVGGTFPESDPIFRLVSLRGGTAKIGIVGGSYASGSQTITLKRGGNPVTLMNTADGTTYVLRLLNVA
jgi:hypothetical protein